ncbi:hypothetical protein PMAYCL1PPCAC_14739 [Pristionchus mayeri]|uniref:Peptidase S9 prolyl oligopeptidase catalytic domain-containing protein n=1 Tax=Pristionchus mayeri TaxID=1317129 RepID=A0AAN5CHK6_9BILA|nr:hypothetical protein PMAYCL1PPCAC_14739 [Pristionchus mayeri]
MAQPAVAEYGSWTSPLTPEAFGQGNCGRIVELRVHKDSVFWIEANITTGKKELYQAEDGKPETIRRWADGLSVQNGVHEYGGGSYIILPSGALIFSTVDGVWIQKTASEEATKVVDSEKKTRRFADFEVLPGGEEGDLPALLAIEEYHAPSEDPHAEPANRIVLLDLAAGTNKIVRSGADFYMQPRVSPCGRFASWMEWNHNNMPWDETTIYVQELEAFLAGTPCEPVINAASGVALKLSGVGRQINYHGPTWSVDGKGEIRFHYTSDPHRFWNVHQVTGWEKLAKVEEPNVAPAAWAAGDKYQGFARGGLSEPVNMLATPVDIGFPPWNFADAQFAAGNTHSIFNAQGTLYVLRDGEMEMVNKDVSARARVLRDAQKNWNTYSHMALSDRGVAYCIAQGVRRAATVLRIDLNTEPESITAVRESRDPSSLEEYDISEGRRIEFEAEGIPLYGVYYAPLNRAFTGPPGALPPMVVMGHSGPTLPTSQSLELKKQFLTSRGFAVFDVCYRGSSGGGSVLRSALYSKWGLADRDDLIAGAALVCKEGLADPRRVAVWGSSATGFTALACAIAAPSVFSAAVSIYGVADLMGLLNDTHKFEKGYNQALVGKLPEAAEEFKKRSPFNHVNAMRTPTVFLHGMEDTVVPVQQSVDMFKELRDRGVTAGLMLFEGEGHGFRSAAAVKESTEAAYFFLCKVLGIEPSVQSKLEIVNLREHKNKQ